MNVRALAQPDTISGIINQYTRITAVDAVNGIFTVDDASLFTLDDKVLIYQTQGAVMNENQVPQFGTVTNANGAGYYEFATVCISNTGSGEVSIQEALVNAYNPSGVAQSGLQLIRVPVYAGDVVVDGLLTAQPWNGQTGGVLALEAMGTVKLDADIDISGQGFRGAEAVNSSYACVSWINGTSTAQNSTLYHYSLASGEGGQKGEGIAPFIANKTCGQGRQTNGGGGGNDHNSGGGGGGNYNGGGQGGERDNSFFNCYGLYPGRGGGGLSPYGYSNNVAQNRAFLGGGGGAGHSESNEAADGGDGGGLLMLKSASFNGNGQQLIARGISANDSLSDGGSGGGAGGALLLEVGFFSADPFTIDLRGGDGGNTAINCEGPGGGGAGGVIWTSVALDPGVIRLLNGGTSGGAVACANSPQNASDGSNGTELIGLGLTQSGGPGVPNCILRLAPFALQGKEASRLVALSWTQPPGTIVAQWLEIESPGQALQTEVLAAGQENWQGWAIPGRYRIGLRTAQGETRYSTEWHWQASPEERITLLDHPWKLGQDGSLLLETVSTGVWQFDLRDIQGRKLWHGEQVQSAGVHPFFFQKLDIAPGTYTLQATSPRGRTFFKIVRFGE